MKYRNDAKTKGKVLAILFQLRKCHRFPIAFTIIYYGEKMSLFFPKRGVMRGVIMDNIWGKYGQYVG